MLTHAASWPARSQNKLKDYLYVSLTSLENIAALRALIAQALDGTHGFRAADYARSVVRNVVRTA